MLSIEVNVQDEHGQDCRAGVVFDDADIAALSRAAQQLLADAHTEPSEDGSYTEVYPQRMTFGLYEPLYATAATIAAVSAALEDLASHRSG